MNSARACGWQAAAGLLEGVTLGVAYAAMLAAPLVLSRRFRADPEWAVLGRRVQVLALASAAAMAVFASRAVQPWTGTVQRVAVTLALAAEILVAVRLLILPPPGSPARPVATLPIGPPMQAIRDALAGHPASAHDGLTRSSLRSLC